jgi:hypothetical protein
MRNQHCPVSPAGGIGVKLLLLATRERQALERSARAVHRLGARAMAELLTEIAAHYADRYSLDLLESYAARLTPEMVEAAGADRFAPWIAEVEQ